MTSDDMQPWLRAHERAAAQLREELAARTAGEVLYDDYLLQQLRKGKPFKIALRKANAKFPAEALNGSGKQMAEVEARYRSVLQMEKIEGYKARLAETDQEIARIDAEIAQIIESVAAKPLPADALSGAGAGAGAESGETSPTGATGATGGPTADGSATAPAGARDRSGEATR